MSYFPTNNYPNDNASLIGAINNLNANIVKLDKDVQTAAQPQQSGTGVDTTAQQQQNPIAAFLAIESLLNQNQGQFPAQSQAQGQYQFASQQPGQTQQQQQQQQLQAFEQEIFQLLQVLTQATGGQNGAANAQQSPFGNLQQLLNQYGLGGTPQSGSQQPVSYTPAPTQSQNTQGSTSAQNTLGGQANLFPMPLLSFAAQALQTAQSSAAQLPQNTNGDRSFTSFEGTDNGDPHLNTTGTTANGQTVTTSQDNQAAQTDLLHATGTFGAGNGQISTTVKDNGNGANVNDTASYTLNNGNTTVKLGSDGTATVTTLGPNGSQDSQTLQKGQSINITDQNGNKSTITNNANPGTVAGKGEADNTQASAQVGITTSTPDGKNTLSTTLSSVPAGGGNQSRVDVDSKITAGTVQLGGTLVAN